MSKDNIVSELFEKLKRWSYSRISTLKSCPARFYKKYILKEQGTAPVQYKTSVGRAIHSILEAALKGESVEKAIETAKQENKLTDEDIAVFKDNIEDIVKRIDRFDKKFKIEDIKIEHRLINKDFYGIADMIVESSDRVLILDHKTTQSKPTLYWYKPQLYLYGALYNDITGNEKPVLHGINFAYHNQIIWEEDFKNTSFLSTVLNNVINDIKQRLAELVETNWEPVKNNLCDYCEYRTTCPIYLDLESERCIECENLSTQQKS